MGLEQVILNKKIKYISAPVNIELVWPYNKNIIFLFRMLMFALALAALSLIVIHIHFSVLCRSLPLWMPLVKGGADLCLGQDWGVLGGGPEEGGEWGGDNGGAGSHKAAKVAAGDVVLLLLHHQGVHHVEHIPGDPDGAVLCEEGRSLEAEGQRGSAIGQEVKPVTN